MLAFFLGWVGIALLLATLLFTRWRIIDLDLMMVGLVVSGAVMGGAIGVLL